ncbi:MULTISPECIES: HpcH/HpaI aldolase/citrate lyase family protein [Sphingomonas]|jgi:citrate lyase subunit beta/citryl-CoA lyase|uniref:Citrate lyase n=1 Tax=Sphingomonas hankookensis TaxID=563996 RepID=A0ABR5YFB9_9SPHN|nr:MULTISPECIES: CoA ester lyase [Sphingomonas]KZE17123.1 citrate lyase [Sphingomonas hankookensis]PZT92318.1 MAG: CoA ester lyase [Sphingomonas sp.]RSV21000.1 CoA ester lyase [Sphingomonas sp. ABOLH]WCP71735.1 CoA ester lyase [Sphingomonas hankookensis]
MRLRSLLFVPGDRADRFAKAAGSGADALILDLEDAVAASAKDTARTAVRDWLAEEASLPRIVRINPVDGPLALADLDALAGTRPDAIMVPKAEGQATITALDPLLAARGLAEVPLLPIATETPAAIFQLGSYAAVAHRLLGITWGAEDLPAAIGATTSREADGRYTAPYELARSLTLFGALAAGVAAIDTVYPAIRDEAGLAAYAARAARDGFTAMMALHPAQVAAINAAFTPSAEAVERAQVIVDAFAANPEAGVLQVDGRMVDAPHLKQARRVLARR